MSYDVAEIRNHFPALREGAAHFDGPGWLTGADRGGSGGRGDDVVRDCESRPAHRGRATGRPDRDRGRGNAMADLLGADPAGSCSAAA